MVFHRLGDRGGRGPVAVAAGAAGFEVLLIICLCFIVFAKDQGISGRTASMR
jgi:hypothetical protein